SMTAAARSPAVNGAGAAWASAAANSRAARVARMRFLLVRGWLAGIIAHFPAGGQAACSRARMASTAQHPRTWGPAAGQLGDVANPGPQPAKPGQLRCR